MRMVALWLRPGLCIPVKGAADSVALWLRLVALICGRAIRSPSKDRCDREP